MPYYLAIDTLLVTCRGEQRRFYRGDELVDVPAGMLAPLVRLGRVTEEVPVKESAPPDEPTEVEDSVPSDPAPADWQAKLLADLPLSPHIKEALADGGLVTVADVLTYGAAHDGSLVSLHGIGAASEKAIQAAIEAIAPQE